MATVCAVRMVTYYGGGGPERSLSQLTLDEGIMGLNARATGEK